MDLSEDRWGFKGQKRIFLFSLTNLWHGTETLLNKTAYSGIPLDAPNIQTGLGALNLLRSH